MIHWTYLTDELAIKLWLTLLAGLIAIIFMWKIIEKTTTPRKPSWATQSREKKVILWDDAGVFLDARQNKAQLLSGLNIEATHICGLRNKGKENKNAQDD